MGFHSDDFAYPGLIPSKSETDDARAHRPQLLTISLGHSNEDDSVEENGSSPQSLSAGASPDFQGPSSDDSHSSPASSSINPRNMKPQFIRQRRTTQACDKCRLRKTKCSGNRLGCLRCTKYSLICEYSVRESRIRTMKTRTITSTVFTNPLQVNFHDGVRPTPAHHSRLGNRQKQAFASSLPGAYMTSPPSHPPRSSHSSSAARSSNNVRLGAPRQVAHDLDTRHYSGGYSVALNSARSHDEKVPRWSVSRSQSHSTLPQYRDSSGVVAANTLFNIPSTSVRETADFLHYGYDCLDESMAGGQPLAPSIHPAERTVSEGGSARARRIVIPDAPSLESGFNSMGAYSSLVLDSPTERGHEPSSLSAFSEQNDSENDVHRYMNEPRFHIPLHRSNQSGGKHSEWINIASSTLPLAISESSVASAVRYDTIISDNVAEEEYFYSQYGRHSSASLAPFPSLASNPSCASSQASSMKQLELLCPAPIMLIGSGGRYGAPVGGESVSDSHDTFYHHHSGRDLGMLLELGQRQRLSASVIGETHCSSYNAPPMPDPAYRFQGYDFFK